MANRVRGVRCPRRKWSTEADGPGWSRPLAAARASPRPSRRPSRPGAALPALPAAAAAPPDAERSGPEPGDKPVPIGDAPSRDRNAPPAPISNSGTTESGAAGSTPGPGSPPPYPAPGSHPGRPAGPRRPGLARSPRGVAAACEVSGVQEEVPDQAGPGGGLQVGTVGAAGREGVSGIAGKEV